MKLILNTIVITLLFTSLAFAGDVKPHSDEEGAVDTTWLMEIINSTHDSIQIIDVRTPGEFAASHVLNAINIPFESLMGDSGCTDVTSKLPADKEIIFMCKGGSKSGGMYFQLQDDCGYSHSKGMYYVAAEVIFGVDGKVSSIDE
ncbi:MAG: hypothetical protein C0603_11780 [Denitrovibrio sp.]|nr:MAG: hypothetical protein C0603_11780 [Denitrovibrio sp.]